VRFDKNGAVVDYSGEPIRMDEDQPADAALLGKVRD
jgi:hypothetical protein